jgi:hypothetical protein
MRIMNEVWSIAKYFFYRVQVPAARGRVIPEIDSIKDDLPAD